MSGLASGAPDFSALRLATPRCRLRPLQVDDAGPLLAMHADPGFMRYWSSPPWTDMAQAQAMIDADARDLPAGRHLRLAITTPDDGFIGTVSLFNLNSACRRAELGYGVAPAHWGRGLATEAIGAVLAHAFGPMALHRLEADVDPRNSGSTRLLERLGFRREGLLRERWIVAGEVSDSALYGLLAADWRAGARGG